jgi:hypothetical protein
MPWYGKTKDGVHVPIHNPIIMEVTETGEMFQVSEIYQASASCLGDHKSDEEVWSKLVEGITDIGYLSHYR